MPKKITQSLILAFLAITSIGYAMATEPAFLNDKYRGWFFHEHEPEPEIVKKPKKQTVVTPPAAPAQEPELKPYTQAWFAKNLPIMKDKAIDQPTEENVMAFLVAQKIWANSASNFATSFGNVADKNPFLTGEQFRPTSSFGSQYYDKRAAQSKSGLIQKLSKEIGIWFFFASYCGPCHAEAPVLRDMSERLGLTVMPISIDGKGTPDFPRFVTDRGQAKKYNVTSTPTMMIYRDNKLYPLAEGLMSSDQITDRILFFAKEFGWITESEWNKAQPVDFNATLSPEFIQSITPEEAKNPALMAEKMKTQLVNQKNRQ